MSAVEHPSSFELDALSLGHGPAALRGHVDGCAECAGHLARLAQPIAVPAWVGEAARPARRQPNVWLSRLAVLTGLAVTVVFGFFLREPEWTGLAAKGQSAAAVYVLRGGRVSLWDGQARFVAGDAVRLELAPEGLENVWVGGVGADGGVTTLYEGKVTAPRALLPLSWTLDGARAVETLDVVLSGEPLDAQARTRAVAMARRDERVWTTHLTLTLGPPP